jgi:transposase
MSKPQKEPLRKLSEQELRELQRIVKATSERMDTIRRAKALLAVVEGQSFTQAAKEAGLKSGDSVCHLVQRFNQGGLLALRIATGRGRKATYTNEERTSLLQEQQRAPDRQEDATATWSLKTLERSLRSKGLPRVGASTIRRVLREAGYTYGQTRTWCKTGTAQRKRKSGVVTVHDPKAEEKKA